VVGAQCTEHWEDASKHGLCACVRACLSPTPHSSPTASAPLRRFLRALFLFFPSLRPSFLLSSCLHYTKSASPLVCLLSPPFSHSIVAPNNNTDVNAYPHGHACTFLSKDTSCVHLLSDGCGASSPFIFFDFVLVLDVFCHCVSPLCSSFPACFVHFYVLAPDGPVLVLL
jgi:hypothetical protein